MCLKKKKKSCLFLCLNPMGLGLDYKEEESIISTSEPSKKAQHRWLCDVEKLMATISGLCRDGCVFSWGINNPDLSLHKPVVTSGMKLPFLNVASQHLAWIRGGSIRESLAGRKREI